MIQYSVQFSTLVAGELDRRTLTDMTGAPLTAETAVQVAEWYKGVGANARIQTREIGEWK